MFSCKEQTLIQRNESEWEVLLSGHRRFFENSMYTATPHGTWKVVNQPHCPLCSPELISAYLCSPLCRLVSATRATHIALIPVFVCPKLWSSFFMILQIWLLTPSDQFSLCLSYEVQVALGVYSGPIGCCQVGYHMGALCVA